MRWFCAQIGAREHYAVPRALRQSGRSVGLYTDFWAGPMVRKLSIGRLRSLGARYHPDLQDDGATTIKSWNWRAFLWEKRLRDIAARATLYDGFIEVGRRFALQVQKDLRRQKKSRPDAVFYAYDTGALEAFEWSRPRGIKCVLNQMDPNRVEVALVRAEERQWPGWTPQSLPVPEAYFVRREQEWKLADRVVVNSEFSRQALLRQGVPSEKLVVIPLCYEAAGLNQKSETENWKSDQPLRVLFLGQVILRKGIQYLMAAARLLEHENIHFDIVGPVGISAEAIASAPKNMTFHGRTGRNQAAAWYRQSHVFVLPTLSDGFAITQLEAMAHGLPVVTTPCCGEVVSDGADGFLVPSREVEAMAQAFQRYLTEPELLCRQSIAATAKAGQFTLARLAGNLERLEKELDN